MLNRPPKPVLTTVPSNLSALRIGCAHSPVLRELVPGQLPMAATVERVLDPAYTTGLGIRVCEGLSKFLVGAVAVFGHTVAQRLL